MSEADELARVLREVSEAMGATSTILTAHPDHGLPTPLAEGSLARAVVDDIIDELPRHRQLSEGEHAWLDVDDGGERRTVLAMPVQPVDGHSRLVLSAIFDRLDEAQRRLAETVYLRRRPFAVGYFRLWQLDRARGRRISALEAALDTTELGVILLDREERLAFVNQAARTILDKGDTLRRGRKGLVATGLGDAVRLRTAVEHVIDANGRGGQAPVLRLERPDRGSLIVSVVPVRNQADEPGDVAAIVYVLDPALDVERLLQPVCKLYHLSRMETRLTCLLAAGTTLAEAATSLRVKEPTVRASLKQIFLKTGVNRQADLVRIMLNSIVRINRDHQSEAL